MINSTTVQPGTPFSLPNVPAGASIGVSPTAGGTMAVQYRISLNGPLRNWTPGNVTADAAETTPGPRAHMIFTATTQPCLVEWNWPDPKI